MQPVPEILEVTVDKDGNVLSTESYMVDEAGNRFLTQEGNDKTSLPIPVGEGELNATIVIPAKFLNEDGLLSHMIDIWVALELTEINE